MSTSTLTAIVSTASAGGSMEVILAGKATPDRITCSRDLAAATPGDLVLVTISDHQMWATSLLGRPASAPEGGANTSPEGQAKITGVQTLTPEWSGSWRGGWRGDRNDLVQGDWGGWGINLGAAYFGRALKSLGTLTSGEVRLYRERGGVFAAQAPTMTLLGGDGNRPAGQPTILASAGGPPIPVGGEAVWGVPSDWLHRLGPSGDAGGIGIGTGQASPYVVIDGPGMRLSIHWERG